MSDADTVRKGGSIVKYSRQCVRSDSALKHPEESNNTCQSPN